MAKPSYFYGIHAIEALLAHRPLDALSLFVQQGRETDSHVQDIIAAAKRMASVYNQRKKTSSRNYVVARSIKALSYMLAH